VYITLFDIYGLKNNYVCRPSKLDVQFVDYDNVRFHLSTPTSKTQLVLSMGIYCWADLSKYGAQDILEREFGEWITNDPNLKEPDYDVTLVLDLDKIPEEGGKCSLNPSNGYDAEFRFRYVVDNRDALIDHISMFKPILMSAPFHRAYAQHAELASSHKSTFQPGMADQGPEEKGELMIIKYRENEAIYVQSANDRVTVVISTLFSDETDRVFGKVFLQVSAVCIRLLRLPFL
jgi:actin related protein 2/3 complex subunit 2